MENFKKASDVSNTLKNDSYKGITPVIETGTFCVGASIFMSVRQAETILMLSEFLETPSNYDVDRQQTMRVNTMFELAMLVRTMAKGVAGEPSSLSIKEMSIGYGHKPSEEKY